MLSKKWLLDLRVLRRTAAVCRASRAAETDTAVGSKKYLDLKEIKILL